jgi:hypothetical protein
LRNIYLIETMKAHGFRYVCVGRGLAGRAELGAAIPARAAGNRAAAAPKKSANSTIEGRHASAATTFMCHRSKIARPFRSAVWQEARPIARVDVSVICPTNADFPKPFEITTALRSTGIPAARSAARSPTFANIQRRCSMNSAFC